MHAYKMTYSSTRDLPCVTEGPNVLLKLNILWPSFPCFMGLAINKSPFSPTNSIELCLDSWLGKKGLTLQQTRIFPAKHLISVNTGNLIYVDLKILATFLIQKPRLYFTFQILNLVVKFSILSDYFVVFSSSLSKAIEFGIWCIQYKYQN